MCVSLTFSGDELERRERERGRKVEETEAVERGEKERNRKERKEVYQREGWQRKMNERGNSGERERIKLGERKSFGWGRQERK